MTLNFETPAGNVYTPGGSAAGNDTQSLVDAATSQGGALSQVAMETADPNSSLLSRAGHFLGDTFHSVLKTLAMPADTLTSLVMSANDGISMSQAWDKVRSQNISMSQELFGTPDQNAPLYQKIGNTIFRFGVDVLADPLTYVGLGEARGVFGLSKLVKVPLGEGAARGLGMETVKTAAGEEAVRWRALSDTGMNFFQKTLSHLRRGDVATETRRLFDLGTNLMNKPAGYVEKQMGRLYGSDFSVASKVKEIMSSVPADLTVDEAKVWKTEQLKVATINATNEAQDALTRATVGAKLGDYEEQARQIVKNVMEKSIINNGGKFEGSMAQMMLDKGGIKFFGESVLAGIKIDAITKIIPGISTVDKLVSPLREFSNKALSLVSTKYDVTGRRADSLIHMEQTKANQMEHLRSRFDNMLGDAFKGIGINSDESKLLYSALDAQTPPADIFQELLYHLANSTDGNKVLEQIKNSGDFDALAEVFNNGRKFANENMGKDLPMLSAADLQSSIPKDRLDRAAQLYNAALAVRKVNKKIAILERNAGIPVYMHRMYMPRGGLPDNVKEMPFSRVIAGSKDAHQFASQFRIYRDIKDPSKIMWESEAGDKVRKLDKMAETERVRTELESTIGQNKEQFDKVRTELHTLTSTLSDRLKLSNIEGGAKLDASEKSLITTLRKYSKVSDLSQADTSGLAKVLNGVAKEFESKPGNVKKILNDIVGNNNSIKDLMDNVNWARGQAERDVKTIGSYKVNKDTTLFVDNQDKVYKLERASLQDIHDKFGAEISGQFDNSVVSSMFMRVHHGVRAATSRDFLDSIASHFGRTESTAPKGWIDIPIGEAGDSKLSMSDVLSGKNGERLLFDPKVAQHVIETMKVMTEDAPSAAFLRGYDKLTNIFKGYVTSLFPMFHGRNAISNVMQAVSDIGINVLKPHYWGMAWKITSNNADMRKLALEYAHGDLTALDKLNALRDTVVMTDKSGYKWTAGNLDDVIQKNVIAFNPGVVGRADMAKSHMDTIQHIEEQIFSEKKVGPVTLTKGSLNPFSSNFKPLEKGNDIGQSIEGFGRVYHFLHNLENTGSVTHAADMTKQFLFDYQNLTRFEKNVMRRIFPFYTYTRKNLELQAKIMMDTPGRINWYSHAFQSVGEVFAGGNLTEAERNALPDWMKKGMVGVVGRNGDNLSLLFNTGIPTDQPYTDVASLGKLISNVNPLMKIPFEVGTGYNAFYDKPIANVIDATGYKDAPQSIKDVIGFTSYSYVNKKGDTVDRYVALRPWNLYAINQVPLISRTVSMFKGLGKDMPTDQKTIQLLTGLSSNQVNVTDEEAKRIKDVQTQLETLLHNAGKGYYLNRFNLSKNTQAI